MNVDPGNDAPLTHGEESPLSDLPRTRASYDQSWLTSLLRPTLITIMVACINVALGAFLHRFLPTAPTGYFSLIVLISVAASIVACASTAWLAQPGQRLSRTAAYRAAEFGLLIMLARFGIWILAGTRPSLTDFFTHPIDTFLDGYFLVALMVLFVSWWWSIEFSSELLAMALQSDELYALEGSTRSKLDTVRPTGTNRQALLDRFVGRWMGGGLLMILLAAGSQIDTTASRAWGLFDQQIDPVVIAAIILYFFMGLILVSQGQLAILRSRWTLERAPVNDSILRNWPTYVLLLLGLIGLVAMLMPLGGTFHLAQIIAFIINGTYALILNIYQFVFFLLLLLLSLLPFSDQPGVPPEAAEPQAVEAPPPSADLLPFADWTGGILFWTLTAVLLFYAASIYFSRDGGSNVFAQLWLRLKAFWLQFFGSFQTWQANRVRRRSADGPRSILPHVRLSQWFERLRQGNLTPEQQIRYYYLSMLEQAEKFGTARSQSETPARFAPRLEQALHRDDGPLSRAAADVDSDAALETAWAAPGRPGDTQTESVQDDADKAEIDLAVETLTAEFERVRYAGAAVAPGEASRVAQLWQQVRRAMGR
jgi:hypothetical protein